MTEIVERIAKVLAHIERVEVDDEHRMMARASIEAMREPTDLLCEAGYSAGTGDWGGKYDNRRELARGRVQPTWQAMIDAALGAHALTSHNHTPEAK